MADKEPRQVKAVKRDEKLEALLKDSWEQIYWFVDGRYLFARGDERLVYNSKTKIIEDEYNIREIRTATNQPQNQ